jgi:hypothetical protein
MFLISSSFFSGEADLITFNMVFLSSILLDWRADIKPFQSGPLPTAFMATSSALSSTNLESSAFMRLLISFLI